jgi:hypothetical protein
VKVYCSVSLTTSVSVPVQVPVSGTVIEEPSPEASQRYSGAGHAYILRDGRLAGVAPANSFDGSRPASAISAMSRRPIRSRSTPHDDGRQRARTVMWAQALFT